MPTVQNTAPRSNTRGDSLADILERVLDTGIVIAGDIRVQLADIELLTIQIRLIICSVDKAQQLGMDWWKGASFLSSDALPVPAAAESSAPALGAEQPSTVADMNQYFAPTEEPAWSAPQAQQPWNAPSGQPSPAWQQPPQPTAPAPWQQQAQQPPAQPAAPQPPAPQPTQQPAPQPTAEAAQPAQASPASSMSDVQAEMLNERLARLERVLEKLVPDDGD